MKGKLLTPPPDLHVRDRWDRSENSATWRPCAPRVSTGGALAVLRRERTWTERGGLSPRLVLARNGMSATRPAICYRLAIYAPLQRSSDDMKLPEFLPLPKIHRRGRSKARSEIGPIGGPDDADPGVPHPSESTPDLGISVSALPPSSPSTPRDQESNGMLNALSLRPV